VGSAKANRREPKTSLGRVFNYKFGCFGDVHGLIYVDTRPHLTLKTRPRFRPVSLSLSMDQVVIERERGCVDLEPVLLVNCRVVKGANILLDTSSDSRARSWSARRGSPTIRNGVHPKK
jgi:hypothetical protein